MRISFLKYFSAFFLLLGAPAFGTAPFVQLGPCGCVWDNSTKLYPPDSRTEGFFSTTVRYQCGYLCQDRNGKTRSLLGDHQVSFRGNEIGNEVVCEGLLYPAHDNPTGEGGRWVNYFWDGVTRAIDARQSSSPTLREWSENACEGSPLLPRSSGGVTPAAIDRMRSDVGLPPFARNTPPATIPAKKLDTKMAALCELNSEQRLFVEGRAGDPACSAKNSGSLKARFENLRQRNLVARESAEALESLGEIESILLCPYFNSSPSAAILKILGDKLSKSLQTSPEHDGRLRSFACTLGLRGVGWSLLPPPLKRSLDGGVFP